MLRCLLEPRLSGPFNYVADRIIFEAITNALWHPTAKTVQYGSVFMPQIAGRNHGPFVLVFFDDGHSVTGTLREEIERTGEPLCMSRHNAFDNAYDPTFQDSEVEEILCKQGSAEDICFGQDASDARLLFASIWPGVTSARGVGQGAFAEEGGENLRIPDPGFGLSILVNATVQVLRGTATLYTKSLQMNVSLGDTDCSQEHCLRVNIRDLRAESFPGNILTVKLPLEA